MSQRAKRRRPWPPGQTSPILSHRDHPVKRKDEDTYAISGYVIRPYGSDGKNRIPSNCRSEDLGDVQPWRGSATAGPPPVDPNPATGIIPTGQRVDSQPPRRSLEPPRLTCFRVMPPPVMLSDKSSTPLHATLYVPPAAAATPWVDGLTIGAAGCGRRPAGFPRRMP